MYIYVYVSGNAGIAQRRRWFKISNWGYRRWWIVWCGCSDAIWGSLKSSPCSCPVSHISWPFQILMTKFVAWFDLCYKWVSFFFFFFPDPLWLLYYLLFSCYGKIAEKKKTQLREKRFILAHRPQEHEAAVTLQPSPGNIAGCYAQLALLLFFFLDES